MKLEAPTRIMSEDFNKDDQEIIDKLAEALNPFLDNVYNALTKQLNINDNINQFIKSFNIIVDSNGKPLNKLQFTSNITGNAQGMEVIRTFGNKYVESTPFVDFVDRNGIIEINNIKGLEANTEYRLVVHIIGS